MSNSTGESPEGGSNPNHPGFRKLGEDDYLVAEQGLLNLALHQSITIFRDGVDITHSLASQAPRINAAYDALDQRLRNIAQVHPKPGPPAKKTPPAKTKKFRDPAKPLSHKLGAKVSSPASTPVQDSKPAMKTPKSAWSGGKPIAG